MQPSLLRRRVLAGFTLVELLVVMAILATLLAFVAPRYIQSVDAAKEAALRTNLRTLRSAIDQHVADRGQYPASVEALVNGRYLREVPLDPVTERRDSWVVVEHPNKLPGVYDIRSAAKGKGLDGSDYATW